ncbi:MAG: hypothetical protein J0L83_09520 [Chitinophagales bacterium]|nr:hypothetical protein [Chitinophagales bacterium]
MINRKHTIKYFLLFLKLFAVVRFWFKQRGLPKSSFFRLCFSVFIILFAFTLLFSNVIIAQNDYKIIRLIQKHQPLKGGKIPKDIRQKLGATHVAGKYYFSNKPYLIEGADKLIELGYGIGKFWFRKDPGTGYYYNSDWKLPKELSLAELVNHPYWREVFQMPFSTIALSVDGAGVKTTNTSAKLEEEEFYQLAKTLLERYKDRKITFILHNWEGDWVMRGGTGDNARWSRKAGELFKAVDGDRYTVLVPSDSTERINAMALWFNARQRGVDRARMEVKDSKCQVFHAIEVNKVLDSQNGIPGIVNSVLPIVKTDMVSWSCYDGMDSTGLALYKGIQYIKKYLQPTDYMRGQKIVFLGEIGIPEQRYEGLMTKQSVIDKWDIYIGVCLALKVPYIMQWELFCNEPKNEALRKLTDTRLTDEMRGFWLIRPDGTKSFAGAYFEQLLNNAGRRLKK